MIEETAVVIDSEGEVARVQTQRQSTCGGCAATNTCGTSVLARFLGNRRTTIRVRNPIGAKPGDRVIVGLPEASLPKASFLFYILPLLTLLGGSLLAEWLAGRYLDIPTEPAAIVCGLLGLLLGLAVVRYYARQLNNHHAYQAVILRQANQAVVDWVTG